MLAERQTAQGPPPMIPLSANPLSAIIAITVIMCVFVIGKVIIRIKIIKKPGLDDYSALIGAAFVIAMTGVIGSIFREAGLDSSSAVASPGQINDPKFADRLFVFLLLSGVPNGFAKLSVLFLLRIIFPRRARPMTGYLTWFGIAVVILYHSILVLYIGIHCGPQDCTVDEQVDIAKGSASINLILDIYILVLAVSNVWTLQMSTRNKIGVMAVFATGLMALACSITVLYYRVVTTEDPDAVWVQVLTPLVLVIYEPSIGLITASLPAAPPLWVIILETKAVLSARRLFTQLTGGSKYSAESFELPNSRSNSHFDPRAHSFGSVGPKNSSIDQYHLTIS